MYHVWGVATRGGSTAARVSMVVVLLMTLYGCGRPAEAKGSFEGVEHLNPEAPASATVVPTTQDAEPGSDAVVEQADRDYRLPPYVYVECGYAEGGCESASATATARAADPGSAPGSPPWYEDTLDALPPSEDILDAFFEPATFKLIVTVLIGWTGNIVLTVLIELIEWLHS